MSNYKIDPNRRLYLESKHWEAINKMSACQTNKLGIAKLACPDCGECKYINQSCKHRFCPTCGIESTYRWAEDTLSRLLKMKHHHIVTTLPSPLRKLSKMNGDKLHDILFRSSSEVLKSWFSHKHGLLPGIVSVLHTAGSDLQYHPHIHMIVTGGGKDLSSEDYRSLKGQYLCPQRFLGKQLRLEFEKMLLNLYKSGELIVFKRIKDATDLKRWLHKIKSKHWIVSIQKPLEDVGQIVSYVGRYTKRACLSEYKIEKLTSDRIVFRANDYKNTKRGEAPKQKLVSLGLTEFLDRLLQHVPNKRYRMVRYSGLYSSYHLSKVPVEKRGIKKAELALEIPEKSDWGIFELYRKMHLRLGKADPLYCEKCKKDYVFVGVDYQRKNKIEKIDDS